MKLNLHPYKQEISLIQNNGMVSTFKFTVLKHSHYLKTLESDRYNNPNWHTDSKFKVIERGGQLTKFKKRFSKSIFTKI